MGVSNMMIDEDCREDGLSALTRSDVVSEFLADERFAYLAAAMMSDDVLLRPKREKEDEVFSPYMIAMSYI
jgi:hypothetical protein